MRRILVFHQYPLNRIKTFVQRGHIRSEREPNEMMTRGMEQVPLLTISHD